MIDRFGRRIDYLRVSITDRCNFRCVYCMPEQGFPATPKPERLTEDEILKLVRIAAKLGVRKVRLTGGEPLLLNGFTEFVARLAEIPGIEDLSATTNGFQLAEMAEPLKRAGLHRLNISLDTLRPDRFRQIARRGDLATVLEGIRAAQAAGLQPVKINAVAMKGVNDDEAADFAEWTLREPIHIRFIELMPMRWSLDESPSPFEPLAPHGDPGLIRLKTTGGDMLDDLQLRRMKVDSSALKRQIEAVHGRLQPAQVQTNGPARSFRLAKGIGTIGFISQISSDLCEGCNRLRLTHDGFLRPCLMSDGELNMRDPLRAGASDEQLAELFRHVVERKPERHYLAEGQSVVGRGMSQIGG